MPLNGAIIKSTSAAVLSVAGGVDVTFTSDGQDIVNGMHFIDASIADFRVRSQLTAKVKQPSMVNIGGIATLSKDKRSLLYIQPFVDTKGALHYPLIRIEREMHPDMTQDAMLEFNRRGAQMLFNANFTNFWALGSVA